ncbi:hypothetical protein QFC22_004677 [Naganishia vaughanmartiniae]|uniref:Uncharacterized protein n=1 Tax=Naganishia vaughanmartiniae TaxID=1424756 RepID=A0ACC2X0U0_9TREE|nr:hypothetical protein QFC22_004677 [Naganishia vaughanmartiniae]
MSISASRSDEKEDSDDFTDVEDSILDSPTVPGQQTPTATNQQHKLATPKPGQRSTSTDSVRRFTWTARQAAVKHDRSGSFGRPKFSSHASFQEVRYRSNHMFPPDTSERDGFHTKGLAPRPLDFAFVTPDSRRKPETRLPSGRPPLNSASSLNRYSLLGNLAPVDADLQRPRSSATSREEYSATSSILHAAPVLSRRTTYSSLPPSPSALLPSEYELDGGGPRSATEASYLETYDQLDQEAFTQALQMALEAKKEAQIDSWEVEDAHEVPATLLPPGDKTPDQLSLPAIVPPLDTQTTPSFLSLAPPLSRTASRATGDHGSTTPSGRIKAEALSLPALDERLVASSGAKSNSPHGETVHPLWQMITEEMNVEQNRLFVIEGKCVPASISLSPILRSLLVIIPTIVLSMTTDVSKMYHKVRGQDTIKLYVIYNALEIADKLCSAFGQDILDTLFSKETLEAAWWSDSPNQHESTRRKRRKRERATPFFFFMLGLAYVHIHALVYFYQLVSLNVAVNSYDNALLTLLVSNQFVEIKGSVFKKFEKENLLQIMCADIVERFQLGLMLSVIAVRNMIEMSGSEIAFLPKSFVKGKSLLDTILSMAVDWLKHAFITKFNHIRSSVYDRYLDVLCKDVVLAGRTRQSVSTKTRNILTDHTLLLGRRLGFASLPLSCLLLRVGLQAVSMTIPSAFSGGSDEAQDAPPTMTLQLLKWVGVPLIGMLIWLSLTALKILLGTSLSTFAIQRQTGMTVREQQDQVNSFGRKPIAENEHEEAYGQEIKQHLSNKTEDIPLYDPIMSTANVMESQSDKKGGKPKWKLEEVERWTMVKRIF